MIKSWKLTDLPILQLGSDFYDPATPAVFPEHKLRHINQDLQKDLQIPHDRFWDFQALPHNLPTPLALRYHGHQFQHYNPQLGDGRGFLYAQILKNHQWYDLGTKGSGQTLYSRAGDGRLTLKGAVREILATEMLETLNVQTSKTLAVFETGESLDRHDEPSPTRSAVLTRFSKGHIRIGTFQRLAYFKQAENIQNLTSYCLQFYAPQIYNELITSDTPDLKWAEKFLQNTVQVNAVLAAEVMMAGFIHGVLNTDNINISGELFDYGPYRFMPEYDANFIAAYFDQQGLYSYGRQPVSFLWALHQLAFALKVGFPELETELILEEFSDLFNIHTHHLFLKKLNLKSLTPESDHLLLQTFLTFLENNHLPFEQTFFDFNSLKVLQRPSLLQNYEKINHFNSLRQIIEKYEILNPDLLKSEYHQNEKATTLLIHEIEQLWQPIAKNDDWSLFDHKLQSIRQRRGL